MADETERTDKTAASPDAASHGARSPAPADQAQSPTAPAFAGKANDLEALRNAVVDAANVGAGLWLSYLFVLVYLVIAVGSVTHRDLLFEHPIKLPFLGVELPLTGFFVLGPGLFLIVHAYVLLHFVLLADKVGAFHDALKRQIADEDTRGRLRRQLPSNIFVQFLAGPVEIRRGVVGIMLRLIAQISLVAGPLALMVFFQLQFLPYHDEAIAWWQRIAVVIDVLMLWALWPSVARGEWTSIPSLDLRTWPIATALLASLAPIFLVFTIATFPGELLDKAPSIRFVPTSDGWTSLHELLVGGDVDLVARKPTSLWSNRLVLPGVEAPAGPVSLRGRRLEGAVLISARMAKVDFTAAQLQEADLTGADLQETKFECAESKPPLGAFPRPPDRHCTNQQRATLDGAQLQKASLVGAQLQGAHLVHAQMQGAKLDDAQLQKSWLILAQLQKASLVGAQLQGALLAGAQMQGAWLDGAQLDGAQLDYSTELQGASLNNAQLLGASLKGAQLQGASLNDARLQGASLEGAQLQGASLYNAQLHGALLDRAQLQGAWLQGAELQGASLKGAQLQGAMLKGAQLQGAILAGAALQDASLDNIFAWRADVRNAQAKGARVVTPEIQPKYPMLELLIDWSATSFALLKQFIEQQVPEGTGRKLALERIATLNPATPLDGQEEMATAWADLARSPPSLEDYSKSLAEALERTGCNTLQAGLLDPIGATPYVIRGLLGNLYGRFGNDNPRLPELATAFLDEVKCQSASRLSEEDRVKLREIRDRAAPAPPDPAPTVPKQ